MRGRVVKLFYSSPKFSAGRFKTKDGRTITFAGPLMVAEHDPLVLTGSWIVHPKYGMQFKVARFNFDQKLDKDGLAQYLAKSAKFKGIGPARAQQIADAFAEDFERVLDEEPELIAELAHVSLETIETLQKEWRENRERNITITRLAALGLTHHQIVSLVDRFGDSILTILKQEPYSIVGQLAGFGFGRVDKLALKIGMAKESTDRMQAGIIHCVRERLGQGDCWVEYEELIELANTLLIMDVLDSRQRIEQQLDELINLRRLVCKPIDGRFLVALPSVHGWEAFLADRFANARGILHDETSDLDAQIERLAPELNDEQRQAVHAAATHPMTLISGGAGSGKTYCIDVITRLYSSWGWKVGLAAPTGKAAKRIEQVVGKEAKTIHRLLGYNGDEFHHTPDNPVDVGVLIIDEVSMLDVSLAFHLLRALEPRTRVIFVGDHNQLPPVGPGNLLRDLIERKPIPAVVLDKVVRQAGVLKENSIAILTGDVRPTSEVRPDGRRSWVLLNQATESQVAKDLIVRLFDSQLEEQWRFDLLMDVQLLSPTKKGPIGVDALNLELQRLIQRKLWGIDVEPPKPRRRPPLLLHDKVIQTRNNYDLGVMNGAIGFVRSVHKSGELVVAFEDKTITIPKDAVRDLSLAYALTIHKAQGSEFPCVIVVVHKSHSFMHNRNLFYTGVTRASDVAIVVGDAWGMRNCAGREELERRKTFLSLIDLPRAEM